MQQESRWIWPFELLEKIGEGGMGVVYKARFVKDNRLLALKMLPADVTDEVILGRFERELEILRTLKHPNVVRTFGGVCEDKRRFYAMELIEGGTLEEVLRDCGRLSWERVIEYGVQMCAALAYSHERGVVHRDVKPGNFLITADGRLKLSDFGLASFAAARKITAAGRTMGTYFYMAPEQIRGSDVGPKADLYAMGCVLFELLTGRPPFTGETPAETLHKHLKQAPARVTESAPDCPAALDTLVGLLLAKDPEARPESAAEVARQLKEVTPTVVVAPRESWDPGSRRSARREAAAGERRTGLPEDRLDERESPFRPAAFPLPGGASVWVAGAVVLAATVLLTLGLSTGSGRAVPSQSENLWVEAYQGGEPAVRLEAARALGEMAAASPAAVETLIAGLEHEDADLRKATVEALERAGAAAKPAVPALRKRAQRDERPEVRQAAAAAEQSILAAPAARRTGRYLAGGALLFVIAGLALRRWLRTGSDAGTPAAGRRVPAHGLNGGRAT